jgi:hypothetical protein
MNARFSAAVLLVTVAAALVSACGNDSSTATTTPTSPTTSPTGTPSPTPTPTPPSPSVSDPGGEWNLTGPAGLPANGCISLSDISGTELDWIVQAQPGHAHRILMQGIVTTGPAADCSVLTGGDVPRSLQITGGGWTFVPGEQGSRTIAWITDQCVKNGGRFQIDVQVRRDVPSVGPSDQESRELIVNCGPAK